jgi:hypothetical protein
VLGLDADNGHAVGTQRCLRKSECATEGIGVGESAKQLLYAQFSDGGTAGPGNRALFSNSRPHLSSELASNHGLLHTGTERSKVDRKVHSVAGS